MKLWQTRKLVDSGPHTYFGGYAAHMGAPAN
jgi:hypothetical protein